MKETIKNYKSTLGTLMKTKSFLLVVAEFALLIISTGFSVITGLFKTLPEFFLSVFLITILFFITKWVTENYVDKENRKTLFIGTIITSVIGLIAYGFIVYNRNFEYLSDHVVYYDLQNELHTLFNNLPLKGFYGIVSSCWNSDYSYFINAVLAAPFAFTTGTNNAFVITYYIVLLAPVCYMNNLLVINIAQRFNAKNVNLIAVLGNITFLTFPLLHLASLLGMPDLFGMFFVFAIFVIMTNYDYTKFSLSQTVIASLLMVFLVITRRWYIFTLIGLYISIIAIKFVYSFFEKDKTLRSKTFLGEVKFIIVTAILMLATLTPFIYRTLFVRNYASDYSDYDLGGFPFELFNQLGYLGILFALLLLVGAIYGFINKKLRPITIFSLLGCFLSMYSFTIVQNMGKHQSLCLVIYYLLLLYNVFILIDKTKNKAVKYTLIAIVLGVLAFNTFSTMTGFADDLSKVFLTTKYAVATRFTWSF